MSIDIKIKLLHDKAIIPSYAKEGDAGLDLYSTENCTLKCGERKLISTGISIALPQGYAAFVQPRSGLAIKHGISIVNTPGLIDSGYRGEIKVILINTDHTKSFHVNKGDRIAQLLIIQAPQICFTKVDELPTSQRGDSGFGSSGTN